MEAKKSADSVFLIPKVANQTVKWESQCVLGAMVMLEGTVRLRNVADMTIQSNAYEHLIL